MLPLQRLPLGSLQAMRLGLGGAGVDAQLKDQRADLNLIAMRQQALANQADAVDEGAVGAAQIAQAHLLRGDAQQTMLPADPGAVGADVTFGAAPEDEFATREEQGLALRLPAHDYEVHLHVRSLTSPSLPVPPVWLAAARSVVRAHPDEALPG